MNKTIDSKFTTTILHISDIHIQKKEKSDTFLVLDPLIDRIGEDRQKNGLSPEIIVVTGDVAFQGIKKEYDLAKTFFDKLLKETGLSEDKLFIVPGNHDVNRTKYRPSDLPSFKDMKALNDELENKKYRKDLFVGLADYFKFVKANYPHLTSKNGDLIPFVTRYQSACGKTIGLVGLNSAWMCRKSPDKEEIAIGEFQVNKAMEELKEQGPVDLVINLFHHPLHWLWQQDRDKLKKYLNESVILSGHLHDADGGFYQGIDGNRFLFQAGGAYLGSQSDWPARYQYMTLDWTNDSIRLDFRMYDKESGKWFLDGIKGDDGSKIFIRAGIASTKGDSKPESSKDPDNEKKTVKPLVIPETYKKWIREECSYMQVDKMAGKGQVIRPELPEVFVPLYAQEPVTDDPKKKRKSRNIETEWDRERKVLDLEILIAQHEYLLIEGQAGSGKTTVLKHLAYVLASDENAPEGLSGYLPVLIFLKDLKFFLDEKDKSLIPAGEILQYYFNLRGGILDSDVLDHYGKAGQTVILLDGLDEINETNRDKVVKAFSDFRCKHPGNKVVLSGRPHGLEGSAINVFGKKKVTVLPFKTEQIHEFINKWFLHVYSESESIGTRNAKDMIAEINGHDAIKKLVDNPLMLTAICILYHDGRELPNQRAELYKKFIDNMIYRRFPEPEKIHSYLRTLAHVMHKERLKSADRSLAVNCMSAVFRKKTGESDQEYKNRLELLFDEIEPQCGLLRLENAQHSFWHLTFQEYLTAVYIVDTSTQFDKAISELWDDPWYEEVVKLYVGYLSIEHKQWATQIIRNVVLDAKDAPVRRKLIAAEALVDIHPDRQDPDLVTETRANMWMVIDRGKSPKDMARSGEVIGYLGDTRNLNGFIPVQGGMYNLEDLGKTKIEPFEIGQYPVTNAWFSEFIRANGYETKSYWSKNGRKWLDETKAKQPEHWDEREWRCPNSPVVGVSWYEAEAFTLWLTQSRKDGFTYRLPIEQEWQAAAAGMQGRTYPWGSDWDKTRCNNRETDIGKTSPVGIFKSGRTPEDVYDLAGNVCEWTSSFYVKDKDAYVLRGGSWYFVYADFFRCAFRYYFDPVGRYYYVGFRCART